MKLYRIHNKWVGDYYLITAINEKRAIEIMDENYVSELEKNKEYNVERGYEDDDTINEFLKNNEYRLSIYDVEEIDGDITQEGIIDSYMSIGWE